MYKYFILLLLFAANIQAMEGTLTVPEYVLTEDSLLGYAAPKYTSEHLLMKDALTEGLVKQGSISFLNAVKSLQRLPKTIVETLLKREKVIMRRLAVLTLITFAAYVKAMISKNHVTKTEMITISIPNNPPTAETCIYYSRSRNLGEINAEMWRYFLFSSERTLQMWAGLAAISVLIPPVHIKGKYYL